MAAANKLAEVMVKQGLLSVDQMENAIRESKNHGNRFASAVVSLGYIEEDQVTKIMEKTYQVPALDLSNFQIESEVTKMVSRELCEKHGIIPVQKSGKTLVVAFSDPGNVYIKDDLAFLTHHSIKVVVAPDTAIQAAIDRYYGNKVNLRSLETVMDSDDELAIAEDIQVGESMSENDAPIVKFVNATLVEAIRKGASDIHIEPYEKRFRIRFRVDGNLVEWTDPPAGTAAAISSRIKIMSKLDIAEKRRPQDGRLKVKVKNKEIDFRVSVMPTLFGEKIVMRILDKSNLQVDMTKLGFESDDLKIFKESIHLPQGMVLITGPTGSGKTTTIYSALAELNTPGRNICTAEDPVEFNLEGINQLQVRADIDLTFASALRSFLRQDPNVIMVGEIRDYDTAEIAFKAASTGHMVVSTIHTNDAPSTIMRLIDMGVPPYVVTSNVTLVVAQRLVGRICDKCKTPIKVKKEVLLDLGVHPDDIPSFRLAEGKGCVQCNNTGMKGRLAIFEVMKITSKIKEAVLNGASTMELRRLTNAEGMRTLRRSALLKLMRGETTIQEVVNSSIKDV